MEEVEFIFTKVLVSMAHTPQQCIQPLPMTMVTQYLEME